MEDELRVLIPANRPGIFYHGLGRMIKNLFSEENIDTTDPVQHEGYELGQQVARMVKSKFIAARKFELILERKQPSRFYHVFGDTLMKEFPDNPSDEENETLGMFHAIMIHEMLTIKKDRRIYNATKSTEKVCESKYK